MMRFINSQLHCGSLPFSLFLLSSLLLSLACCFAFTLSQPQSVMLTIAYCPTLTSGEGAIVKVDPMSGNWSIVGRFKWPSAIIGCPAEDPTVTFDPATNSVFLYFIDESLLVTIDVERAKISNHVTAKNIFFTGFENMYFAPKHKLLQGVSADVTQSGFCSDGCFAFGDFGTVAGTYTKLQDLPFKAMLDDSHYWDNSTSTFYIQGSYDLREQKDWCAPVNSDMCLLAVNSNTGSLLSAKWTNFTVYKYGPPIPGKNGELLAWVEGFDSLCRHPFDNFLFASVNVSSATASPIACISRNVTIDMDEWIASFSSDGTMMATGSGDYTGVPQLLVFNTNTGEVDVNSDLSGLGRALGARDNLFNIWSVDFV